MIKLFRNIRQNLLDEGKTSKYFNMLMEKLSLWLLEFWLHWISKIK